MTMLGVAILIASIPLAGAEVLCHDIPSAAAFAPLNGERAYSIAGVWCNIGDAIAVWDGATPNHPVTAVNLHRVEDGVLQQIGAAWAWHHLCALQSAACGFCTPAGPGCPGGLGVGCSTTDSAAALAIQSRLGRRSDINASTGGMVFPFTGPPITSSLDRRCRVLLDDVDQSAHPGAAYAFESLSIHPAASDPTARCATRRVQPASLSASPVFMGPATEASTAIDFWKSLVPDLDVVVLDVPDDGRIIVAGRVTAVRGGGWRYDYAIENINSHESVGGFSVPLPAAASADEFRFHAPLSHSGEVTSNTPWTVSASGGSVAWSTDSFATNPNANAVRWGTTYTFGFDSDRAPANGTATLTLFRSGVLATVSLPAPSPIDPDLNGDALVGSEDLAILLGSWGTCAECPADLDDDGAVGANDLAILLGAWTG